MTKSVGSGGEPIRVGGVYLLIVAVIVAVHVEDQPVLVYVVLPQQQGQVLVERDVLDDGDVDVPGFLVQGLVTPVRVELAQLPGYLVMVPGQKMSEPVLLVRY